MTGPKFAVVVEDEELTNGARDDLKNTLQGLADQRNVTTMDHDTARCRVCGNELKTRFSRNRGVHRECSSHREK